MAGNRGRSSVVLATIVAGLLLAACGLPDGEFLGQPGPAIGWVGDAEHPESVEVTTTTVPLLAEIESVTWTNEDLAIDVEGASPTEVTRRIYQASTRTDRYVQAAPIDIAMVLPGIDVPAMVPSDVAHVTSQLVFDPTTGRLDDDPAAAFGFWTVEPYSQSRSVGQRAVLFVSLDADAELQITSAEDGCVLFAGRGSCEPTGIGTGDAWWLTDDEGSTLVWFASPHRYELTLRGTEELAESVAASLVPLVGVVDR